MGELEIFSIRIKELRTSLNMTQKEFSEHVGIKQQTLSGYERGIMKPPLDIAKEIAEKCNVSLDWLCGLTDKKNYSDKIETYSDVIKILGQIEQTDIRMEIIHASEVDHPEFHGFADTIAIAFDNAEMSHFLADYEQILEFKRDNVISDRLYKLWLEDTAGQYHKKIQEDRLVDALYQQYMQKVAPSS